MHIILIKWILLSISIILLSEQSLCQSPFTFYPNDRVEEIMNRMINVNRDNCRLKSWEELTLPWNTVGQVPVYNTLHKVPWKYNRTNLLIMHNLAMNRGFFYSFILQRLNTTETFLNLPNLHYYYLSASADVSANPGRVNGSAILFDTNCTYANWYKNLEFNTTLPLFGPKAWRLDDWNDEINWLRGQPSNYTLEVTDYGAGPNHNYTSPTYKFNPWIKDKERQIGFIPDYDQANDQEFQYYYETEDLMNNTMVKTLSDFFGPPTPGVKENFQPVRFTRPYYDCGRSNKWTVTAVGPVIDVMYRYVEEEFKNVRRPQIVGISLMDIDFLHIDFNPCPESLGNDPYYLTGQARCKPTTICEPLSGFGFYRGGYMCHCKPGYRMPYYQNGPYRGVDIEMATEEEYRSGFDCIPVQWQQVIPEEAKTIDGNSRKKRDVLSFSDENTELWLQSESKKAMRDRWNHHTIFKKGGKLTSRYVPSQLKMLSETKKSQNEGTKDEGQRGIHPKYDLPESLKHLNPQLYEIKRQQNQIPHEEMLARTKRAESDSRDPLAREYHGQKQGFDSQKWPQINKLMQLFQNISDNTCSTFPPDLLEMPGEVGYGSERVFELQARMALRLAHFLSAYYQNHIRNEQYGNLRIGRTIQQEHLYGEIIANVASDVDILSSGVFFDHQKFRDDSDNMPDLFGPFAYKGNTPNQAFQSVDLGLKTFAPYTEKKWFRILKERWGSNSYGLERFRAKPLIRSDLEGRQLERYFHYPLYYSVPRYEDGYWTNPYFDCTGKVKKWQITYSAPFFGRVGTSNHVEFLGVVTITVPLAKLDIDQCPSNFYTPNFFKNTATCDYSSTYCVHLPKTNFELGNYKCECRQGFEYPFNGAQWFYLGGETNNEYNKMLAGQPNRFDTLICRESGVARLTISFVSICCLLLTTLWNN